MRLSVLTDYSIRVLMYSAIRSKELSTTKEVSEYYDISYNHLVKVVHKLSSNDFLVIKKGRRGGFMLSRPAREITLGEVVQAIEPDFEIAECWNKNKDTCLISNFCKVKSPFKKAAMAFLNELDKYTLADMVRGTRKKW